MLHVLDAPNCLYSVSHLDKGEGHVDFKNEKCWLKDRNRRVIGMGTKKNCLYRLLACVQLLEKEKSCLVASNKLT